MIMGIITAALVVGVVGIFIGLFLGVAGIKFKVEIDEKEEAVLNALPGNNCGGCGYPGCSGLATAIVKGEAAINACPVGGDSVAKEIALIMGQEISETVAKVAFVNCRGTCDNAKSEYKYYGTEDCRILQFVPGGGAKTCKYGCLGYGSCVKVCPFDAVHIVDGIAVVDKEQCKACGKCIDACPKQLIDLVPKTSKYIVTCMSKDKGPITMKACDIGCIGCGLCAKVCPKEAIVVENFYAKISQEKCIGCGLCAEKCPKKSIITIL